MTVERKMVDDVIKQKENEGDNKMRPDHKEACFVKAGGVWKIGSLLATIAVAAAWPRPGQAWNDPSWDATMRLCAEIDQTAREIDATIAADRRKKAELEARAVRGFLYYEGLSNLNVGSFDQWGARRELSEAMQKSAWQQAIGLCELILIKTRGRDGLLDVELTPAITRLSDFVTLAFLDLNFGRTDKTVANLETAIQMMRTQFGNGTERAAVAFLSEVRGGRANVEFSSERVCELTQAIVAEANGVYNVRQAQLDARLDAEVAKAQRRLTETRREHYRTTQLERTRAKEEFTRKTGLDFDKTYRPNSDCALQREWDRCETILNIYRAIEKPN